ncbi:MAG: methyltransferase domain-containing protein [Alphaproteobacteria bacterium]|nr:methyltransferase domain-containing protein [Alphaproteobacteria bacterium]MBV9860768.1 methyltransferase domain-containing protein [Alphaproteobacteria bacterium]
MTVNGLLDPEAQAYLAGRLFDENVTVQYRFDTPLRDRVAMLCDLILGKRVLHIGCCDHVPLLEEKITRGTWLHGRLTEVAAHCVGIDIDDDAVRRTRATSGLDNIFHGDITLPEKIPQIAKDVFDYAVFGEVLEHIGNPVQFLNLFLSHYGSSVKAIIITVPNALRAGNIKNILRGRETINSDHRFFFTPYTLAKVAWDAGLTVVMMQVALYSRAGRVKQAILNRFPLFAEDLVYVGTPRQPEPADVFLHHRSELDARIG